MALNAVGIVVEYNPLHNGHVYHCQQSRLGSSADAVVAVMSGHFLQRGEPAVANKWARTEMALAAGVDLVLELPIAYACSPAEWFGFGAVSVLDATGVVDALCFGSESGDIAGLRALARRLAREPEAFRAELRGRLKAGASYPAAYGQSVEAYLRAERAGRREEEDVAGAMDPAGLAQPNNNLGLHYLLALERLGSRIEPLTIRRQKAGYLQTDITDAKIASATALRGLLFEHGDLDALRPYVPSGTLAVLRREWEAGRAPVSWASFDRPLAHLLLAGETKRLSAIAEVSEGLEHRIKRALADMASAGEPFAADKLLERMKTKRYTHAKLQRTLLRILLQHSRAALSRRRLREGVSYIRVLGFTDKGRELLKRMKRAARVPVLLQAERGSDDPFLAMDIRATGAYALAYRDAPVREALRDYYEPPVRL